MSNNHDKNKTDRADASKNKRKSTRRAGKQTAAERRRELRETRADSPYAAFETDVLDTERSSDSAKHSLKSPYSNFESASSAQSTEEKDNYFDMYYGKSRTPHREKTVSKSNSRNPQKSRSTSKKKKSDEYLTEPAKVRELTAKQRKLRALLCNIGVFLAVVIVAIIASVTILFKTDEFVVEGSNLPYDNQAIVEASGLGYGDNIFLARRKAAAKKIVEAFPYIESAEVTFKIPGTIVITTETAIPSYEVKVNGGYAVISAQGRVLEKIDAPSGSIPLLKGVKVTDTEVGQYIKFENETTQQILAEVIDSINENSVPNIYGVDISNSANIKLNYDNRITILVGVPEDVGYKLRTAMAIINNELAATDKGDLDVSLANSDRKASYFTPIYSNTVTIDSDTDYTNKNDSDTDSKSENNSQTASTY